MPTYAPKMQPVPLTAARLTKDLNVKAGSWIGITEDSKVVVIGHDTFMLLYGNKPQPVTAPAIMKRSQISRGEWHPRLTRAVALHVLAECSRNGEQFVRSRTLRDHAPAGVKGDTLVARLPELCSLGLATAKRNAEGSFYTVTPAGVARVNADLEEMTKPA